MPPIGPLGRTAIAIAISHICSADLSAAILTVNDMGDDPNVEDSCTLREAIESANTDVRNADCGSEVPNGADQIVFTPLLIYANPEITLENSALSVSTPMSIRWDEEAAGGEKLTISSAAPGNLLMSVITFAGEVLVEGIAFKDNSNDARGGAMTIAGSNLATLNNVDFYSNSTTDINGPGGALSLDVTTATIKNSDFDSNSSQMSDGGAIDINSSVVTIESSLFSNNSAPSATGNAGAIDISGDSNVTIRDTAFYENSSGRDGGSIRSGANTMLTMSESEVSGSEADRYGGGIYLNNSEAGYTRIENVSVVSNTAATSGGGVFLNNGAKLYANNVSLVGNLSSGPDSTGGGLSLGTNTTAGFSNSIITGNSASLAQDIFDPTSERLVLADENLVGDGLKTTTQAVGAFGANNVILATSDGNTPTPLEQIIGQFSDLGGSDFVYEQGLAQGSPAIGAGRDSLCSQRDQRSPDRGLTFMFPIVIDQGKTAVIDLGDSCDLGATQFRPGDELPSVPD